MSSALQVSSADAVVAAINDARSGGYALELRGGGSKALIGADREVRILDLSGSAGVLDYDPAELVLTCGAGTLLADVRSLVAGRNQMLAFDPFDPAALLGGAPGRATIGGVIAAGVAGSQRLSQGGARDHVLGLQAVSGRGQVFKAGAKVVKNVTGYDLPKLLAGSWGRLAALTEVTLKVMPAPETSVTVVLHRLAPRAAVAAMSAAMGSQAEVAAAAYLPASEQAESATLLRVQGFAPSMAARIAMLAPVGEAETLIDERALWERVRDVAPLHDALTLWRIVLPAQRACDLLEALEPFGARWLMDWAGGLIWLALDDRAKQVREVAARHDGHAMLVRAPATVRNAVPTFHPESAGVAALTQRVRRAFDPDGVFESARFEAGRH